jgi:hypothetical protein
MLIWMVDEMRYAITVDDFTSHIGLRSHFKRPKRLHDKRILSKLEMSLIHAPGLTPSLHLPHVFLLSLPHFIGC